jgi:hypothetical protein
MLDGVHQHLGFLPRHLAIVLWPSGLWIKLVNPSPLATDFVHRLLSVCRAQTEEAVSARVPGMVAVTLLYEVAEVLVVTEDSCWAIDKEHKKRL